MPHESYHKSLLPICQVIVFHQQLLDERLSSESTESSSVALLDPSSCFLIAQVGGESLAPVFEARGLPHRDLVILTVNNNPDPARGFGGSHWSLLVWVKALRAFLHVDSMRGTNARIAKDLARSALPLLSPESQSVKVTELSTPQQPDNYDCGVYAMRAAEVLATSDMRSLTVEGVQQALIDGLSSAVFTGRQFREQLLQQMRERGLKE